MLKTQPASSLLVKSNIKAPCDAVAKTATKRNAQKTLISLSHKKHKQPSHRTLRWHRLYSLWDQLYHRPALFVKPETAKILERKRLGDKNLEILTRYFLFLTANAGPAPGAVPQVWAHRLFQKHYCDQISRSLSFEAQPRQA
jgi:hypothetical protein